MIDLLLSAVLSISPVLCFLGGLIYLDTYKLVPLSSVVRTVLIGCGSAMVAMAFNRSLLAYGVLSIETLVRVVAPVGEEVFKALWPLLLLKRKKAGFLVDAGVYGFASGAGFAVVENIVYLQTIDASSPLVWVVRGFGTAVMHGGTTAIVTMLARSRMDVKGHDGLHHAALPLLAGIVVHGIFNQFFFSPLMVTLIIVLSLPPVMVFVFHRSELATRQWLGLGFDTDADLLRMVTSGSIAPTPVGEYLRTISDRFQPEVVVDLLCYLRIYLELAVQAKGILLMREAGFDVPPAPDTDAKFKELEFLERSIGATGKLALHPFLRVSSKELWQMNVLKGG